jgi:hypothetical protein
VLASPHQLVLRVAEAVVINRRNDLARSFLHTQLICAVDVTSLYDSFWGQALVLLEPSQLEEC